MTAFDLATTLETHIGWVLVIVPAVLVLAALVIAGIADLLGAIDEPAERDGFLDLADSPLRDQAANNRAKRH